MTLDKVDVGQSVTISGFTQAHPQLRRKLLALGLMPGASALIKRVAPLGDPIQLQLKGTSVSLRHQEASILLVNADIL